MRRFSAGIWVLFSMFGVACSSGTESEKRPSEQCDDFVHAYCDKAVSCAATTDRADFGETCAFAFRVYVPCEKVTSVQGDVQSCLDALHAISCDSVVAGEFPASPTACQRLFGVEQ